MAGPREVTLGIEVTEEGRGYRLTYHYGGKEADRFTVVAAEPFDDLVALAATHYYLAPPGEPLERLALLTECGRRLFRFLDGPERLLAGFLGRSAGDASLVVLSITAREPVANLPWELLHDGTGFLVTARLPVVPVRQVLLRGPRPEPALRPLRLMFMACAPTEGGLAVLDYDAEHDVVMDLARRYPIEPRVEDSGNLDELGYQLVRKGDGFFDVIHLSGHAGHSPDGPFFATEGLEGNRIDADDTMIAEALASAAPSVVFLSGCRTGEASDLYATVSLAESLAGRGVAPAVIGWGRPVADRSATAAAAVFYEKLAGGRSVARALQSTYVRMFRENDPYWHTLRAYVCGRLPGPLIGSADDIGIDGWVRDIPAYEYVPERRETPFVGRRRELQEATRLLGGRDAEPIGLVLYGMGGNGKSRLARRIQERLRARYDVIKVENELTADKLLLAIGIEPGRRPEVDDPPIEWPLVERLTHFLREQPTPLLFDLDAFEYSYETDPARRGAILLVDGRPVIKPEAADTLDALVRSIQRCGRGPHRIVLTTRYQPVLDCLQHFAIRPLDPLGDADVNRMISRLLGMVAKGSPAEADVEKVRKAAGGNARLLENLLKALEAGAGGAAPDAIAALLRGKQLDFLEKDVIAPVLLDDVVAADDRAVLRAAASFIVPVASSTLARLTGEDVHTLERRAGLLADLGLLGWTRTRAGMRFRLPPVLAPMLIGTEDAETERARSTRAARVLAAELGDLDDLGDPRYVDDEALREVLRLAARSDDLTLELDAAVALADLECFFLQYQRAKATCETTLARCEDSRLRRILAEAHLELGLGQADLYFAQALAACPADAVAERASILASRGFWTGEVLPGDRLVDLEEAIDLARRSDARGTLAFALRTKARALAVRRAAGDAEQVPLLLEEAMGVLADVPDSDVLRAAVMVDRAIALHLERDDIGAALADLYGALEIDSKYGSSVRQAITLLTIADAALQLGFIRRAEEFVDDAESRTSLLRMRVGVEIERAVIARERNDLQAARRHYAKAADLAREKRHLRDLGDALDGLVNIALDMRDTATVRKLTEERDKVARTLREPVSLVNALISGLPAELEQGAIAPAQAIERAREAATVAGAAGMPDREREAWQIVVDNDAAADSALLEGALRRLIDLCPPDEKARRARTTGQLGRALLRAARFAEAQPHLEEAFAFYADQGLREASAELQERLSDVARGLRRPDDMRHHLGRAARIRVDAGLFAAAARSLRVLAVTDRDTHPHAAAEGLVYALRLAEAGTAGPIASQVLGELADLLECAGRAEADDGGAGVDGAARPADTAAEIAAAVTAAIGEADPTRLRLRARETVRRTQALRIDLGSELVRQVDPRGRRLLDAVERVRADVATNDGWTLPQVRLAASGAPSALTIRVWGAVVVDEDLGDVPLGPIPVVAARLREVARTHGELLRAPAPPRSEAPAVEAVVADVRGWLNRNATEERNSSSHAKHDPGPA